MLHAATFARAREGEALQGWQNGYVAGIPRKVARVLRCPQEKENPRLSLAAPRVLKVITKTNFVTTNMSKLYIEAAITQVVAPCRK